MVLCAEVGAFIWSYDDFYYSQRNNNIGIGITGVIGAEYTFEDIPLVVSLDRVPAFIENGGDFCFDSGYGALRVNIY